MPPPSSTALPTAAHGLSGQSAGPSAAVGWLLVHRDGCGDARAAAGSGLRRGPHGGCLVRVALQVTIVFAGVVHTQSRQRQGSSAADEAADAAGQDEDDPFDVGSPGTQLLLPENPSGPDSSTMRPDIPSKHLAARPGWSWRRDTRHDGPDGGSSSQPRGLWNGPCSDRRFDPDLADVDGGKSSRLRKTDVVQRGRSSAELVTPAGVDIPLALPTDLTRLHRR
jgi:hypothetical protein